MDVFLPVYVHHVCAVETWRPEEGSGSSKLELCVAVNCLRRVLESKAGSHAGCSEFEASLGYKIRYCLKQFSFFF